MRSAEDVLRELRQRLDQGAYPPGDRLPPERALASELDVGRAVLRRALAVLEAEGRIWRGVGQGTFAGDGAVEAASTHVPGASMLSLAEIRDLTSPAEVMEVRLALEPPLARLAAHRATSRELDAVEHLCDKAATATTQRTYELWDGRLHHAVAAAAHNRLFLALFEALNAVRDNTSWGQARQARRSQEWQHTVTAQHRSILEALRQRDAEAAEARMARHLEAVRVRLLGSGTADKSPAG